MIRRYKHIFFDLDNTLFDFTASEHLALHDLYQNHLDNIGFTDFDEFIAIYDRINLKLWSDYRDNLIKKDDVKYGRFIKTLKEKNIDNNALATLLAESFVDKCAEKSVLVEGAMEVVKLLSEKYELHIISNGFVEAQYRKLNISGLDKYFKSITLSEEIKTQKPDKKFFQHALVNVNARKTESLVIGDNLVCDIEGAMKFGIDAIYYSYHGTNPENAQIKTIFKLNELLKILL